MSNWTLTDKGLTIRDPESFGFDASDLENPDFKVVSDEFDRERRSYNVYTMVIKHIESGRCFAAEYSTHENEGFEWGPGMGDNAPSWTEVVPHEIVTLTYRKK